MKKILVAISFFGFTISAISQNLTVEGSSPNLYITHIVAPKENFYSIGRSYNQAPKAIAGFNSLAMEKGLAIGQHIKIPLNNQNLDNSSATISTESIPLTHLVAKSESLSKIGADFNVSAEAIKKWNNLSADNIAPGTPLVVGHLRMSATQPLAKALPVAPVANQPEPVKEEVSVAKKVTIEPKPDQPVVTAPLTQKVEEKTIAKQEPVTQPEVSKAAPVAETPAKQASIKEEIRAEEPKKTVNYSYASTNNIGSVEGVFANSFTAEATQKSMNSKSGEAATFKSTSGWQDKKYYILMNEAAPGTIVKITSQENKIVYAKVLGSMPEMKENNGLLLRISNAAASYLGIIDPKFPVQISYYQ